MKSKSLYHKLEKQTSYHRSYTAHKDFHEEKHKTIVSKGLWVWSSLMETSKYPAAPKMG